MKTPEECRRCGVCCFSAAERYVVVTGADWSRLGAKAQSLATFDGHEAFMRMSAGHCAALAVRQTPGGEPDFFCTIYDRRPQICRDLERGSPQCDGERATKMDVIWAMMAPAPAEKLEASPDLTCT